METVLLHIMNMSLVERKKNHTNFLVGYYLIVKISRNTKPPQYSSVI